MVVKPQLHTLCRHHSLRVVLSHMVVKLPGAEQNTGCGLRVVLSHMVVKHRFHRHIWKYRLRVVLSHMVVKLSTPYSLSSS